YPTPPQTKSPRVACQNKITLHDAGIPRYPACSSEFPPAGGGPPRPGSSGSAAASPSQHHERPFSKCTGFSLDREPSKPTGQRPPGPRLALAGAPGKACPETSTWAPPGCP